MVTQSCIVIILTFTPNHIAFSRKNLSKAKRFWRWVNFQREMWVSFQRELIIIGIDLLDSINEEHLIRRGKKLYEDFKKMEQDKSPAEEYDLIRWWTEDLGLDQFFNLVTEKVVMSDLCSRLLRRWKLD